MIVFSRVLCLLIGYLCGNVLTANIVAERMAHKQVFDLGDGNPGMANVGHCLGVKAAAWTLAGDILKVVLAAVVSLALFPALGSIAMAWAGLGATLGHNYPFWHGFRGGKGVATTCSTIILASPILGGLASILGFVAVVVSEYLCVGAVAIPAFFLLFMLVDGNPDLIVVALALLLLMIPQHWPAIRDISTGKTPKAGISRKVRERFQGKRAEESQVDRTIVLPVAEVAREEARLREQQRAAATGGTPTRASQRRRPRQRAWRNASWLDRSLPLIDEEAQRVWSVPPASAFPTKPVAAHAPSYNPYNPDPLEAERMRGTTPHTADRKPQAPLDPGSTVRMVIPTTAAPRNEANPLQQAIVEAQRRQVERSRQEAQEVLRRRPAHQRRVATRRGTEERSTAARDGMRMPAGGLAALAARVSASVSDFLGRLAHGLHGRNMQQAS